jgi:hypothetical protein
MGDRNVLMTRLEIVIGTAGRHRRRTLNGRTQELEREQSEVRNSAQVSCPVGADVDARSRYEWAEGVQIDALQDLERLTVRTRNSTYEIMVLRHTTGEVLVRGGQFFPEYTLARLAGTSLGGNVLKRHGVYVGFGMALQHNGQIILTTRVRSLERESDYLHYVVSGPTR